MLSERPRNIIVGLTFLVALVLLMYGIVLLGKFPFLGGIHRYPVLLMADNANGVGSGARVEIGGVNVGQVESSWLGDNGKGKLVAYVRLNIDADFNIPESATAILVRPSTVGSPYVDIKAESSQGPFLKKDGTAIVVATAGDSGLIPKEIIDNFNVLSHQLGTVAQDLHTLLVYTTPEDVENAKPDDPAHPRVNASTVIIRLDKTVASLQQLLADPKLQGQVRTIVQNMTDASEQLKTTLDKVNTTLANANSAISSVGTSATQAIASVNTSVNAAATNIGNAATQATASLQAVQRDIDRVSQQLVATLDQLEKSSRDITEGKGTTGRLVQDPRLYENLIDLSKSLKSTVQDLDFLVNKWKDEGLPLHLK